MVKFIKSLPFCAKVTVLFIIMAALNYQLALAAPGGTDTIGEQLLTSSTTTMSSLLVLIANVVRIALGIGALVTLVLAIFNLIKGEREAAQKIGYWVVGLALGFALISVVVSVVTTNVQ